LLKITCNTVAFFLCCWLWKGGSIFSASYCTLQCSWFFVHTVLSRVHHQQNPTCSCNGHSYLPLCPIDLSGIWTMRKSLTSLQ
jgi:hypothetical protein